MLQKLKEQFKTHETKMINKYVPLLAQADILQKIRSLDIQDISAICYGANAALEEDTFANICPKAPSDDIIHTDEFINNANALSDLIYERLLKMKQIWFMGCTTTNTPFLSGNGTMFIYTDQKFVDAQLEQMKQAGYDCFDMLPVPQREIKEFLKYAYYQWGVEQYELNSSAYAHTTVMPRWSRSDEEIVNATTNPELFRTIAKFQEQRFCNIYEGKKATLDQQYEDKLIQQFTQGTFYIPYKIDSENKRTYLEIKFSVEEQEHVAVPIFTDITAALAICGPDEWKFDEVTYDTLTSLPDIAAQYFILNPQNLKFLIDIPMLDAMKDIVSSPTVEPEQEEETAPAQDAAEADVSSADEAGIPSDDESTDVESIDAENQTDDAESEEPAEKSVEESTEESVEEPAEELADEPAEDLQEDASNGNEEADGEPEETENEPEVEEIIAPTLTEPADEADDDEEVIPTTSVHLMSTFNVNKMFKENALEGAKTPHRTSPPMIFFKDGEAYLAAFTFLYTPQDIKAGKVDRPTSIMLADITTGKFIGEYETTELEFSDASYDEQYSIKMTKKTDTSKEYYKKAFAMLDEIRSDFIEFGMINRAFYRQYLEMLTANIPEEYQRFYHDLSNCLEVDLNATATPVVKSAEPEPEVTSDSEPEFEPEPESDEEPELEAVPTEDDAEPLDFEMSDDEETNTNAPTSEPEDFDWAMDDVATNDSQPSIENSDDVAAEKELMPASEPEEPEDDGFWDSFNDKAQLNEAPEITGEDLELEPMADANDDITDEDLELEPMTDAGDDSEEPEPDDISEQDDDVELEFEDDADSTSEDEADSASEDELELDDEPEEELVDPDDDVFVSPSRRAAHAAPVANDDDDEEDDADPLFFEDAEESKPEEDNDDDNVIETDTILDDNDDEIPDDDDDEGPADDEPASEANDNDASDDNVIEADDLLDEKPESLQDSPRILKGVNATVKMIESKVNNRDPEYLLGAINYLLRPDGPAKNKFNDKERARIIQLTREHFGI